MLLRGSSEDANSVCVECKNLIPFLLTKFCEVNTVMYTVLCTNKWWLVLIAYCISFDKQGLKRNDQSYLVDLFRSQLPTLTQTVSGGTAAGGHTPLSASVSSPEHESSRIKKLEKLIKKRL